MDPEFLLARLKKGQPVSEADVETVRTALSEGARSYDPYTLIHVLWKSGDRGSNELLSGYLEHPDEMLRRISLQALGEMAPCDATVDRAMRLLEEDPSEFVRMVAATVVGDLGAQLNARRSDAARALVNAFDKCESVAGPEWEACYEGMMNLVGLPVAGRPLATRPLRKRDLNQTVLARAREWAASREDL